MDSDTNGKDLEGVESCSNALTEESCEEIDDPLNDYQSVRPVYSLIPDYPVIEENNENVSSMGNEIYNIAPGENKHPVSFMTDHQCEELAF